jgi:hypothetical protein
MRTWISPAELYAHAGHYLHQVGYGKKSFLIKKRGKILAKLTPITASDEALIVPSISKMRQSLSSILGTVSLSRKSVVIMSRKRGLAMFIPDRRKA